MPIIISQSGKVFHLTGDFTLQPLVSFSRISVLSPLLPSSEEGRAAFKITEGIVATVQMQLHAPSFMSVRKATNPKKAGKEEAHVEEGLNIIVGSVHIDNIVESTQ